MEIVNALDKLGVGLSRLLRYSFGGFLLIVLAAVLNPTDTGKVLKEMPWQLTALSVVVLGAGIYAAHRSLVIPVHHLGLCFLMAFWEWCSGIQPSDSTSPTRWLGSIGVPRFRRMLAYTTLRRGDFFSDRDREAQNISHAESGLVVVMAEGFLAAMVYALVYPAKSQIDWVPLCILSVVFLIASYPGPIGQHSIECMRFRHKAEDVRIKLWEFGILPSSENGQTAG